MTILDSPKMYKTADGTLYHWVPKYVRWAPGADMILDGAFTVDDLEALARHMRDHAVTQKPGAGDAQKQS